MLRKQNGFKDEITFVEPNGKEAIAISLWDRKESADQYGRDTYPQVLKGLSKMVEGTPEVHAYEVGNSTFHKIAATIYFFFQAEDGIRDGTVTGVQTCALPI